MPGIGELEASEPMCLIHGDTHLGNLYIEADGTPGFFDAQVARAPWHLEVSYHIVCALDIADRKALEQALFVHYLEGAEGTRHRDAGLRVGLGFLSSLHRLRVFHFSHQRDTVSNRSDQHRVRGAFRCGPARSRHSRAAEVSIHVGTIEQRANLKGKVAAIVGGASGIGAAVTLALATVGVDIAFCDINS